MRFFLAFLGALAACRWLAMSVQVMPKDGSFELPSPSLFDVLAALVERIQRRAQGGPGVLQSMFIRGPTCLNFLGGVLN